MPVDVTYAGQMGDGPDALVDQAKIHFESRRYGGGILVRALTIMFHGDGIIAFCLVMHHKCQPRAQGSDNAVTDTFSPCDHYVYLRYIVRLSNCAPYFGFALSIEVLISLQGGRSTQNRYDI